MTILGAVFWFGLGLVLGVLGTCVMVIAGDERRNDQPTS